MNWIDDHRALIDPPGLSPLVADPSSLFPEETPDDTWRLYAHTAFGIHAFSSGDGHSWRDRGIVVWNAMRPFVRRFPDGFRLYYEKHRLLALPLQLLPRRPEWNSRIEMRFSPELLDWGSPRTPVEPRFIGLATSGSPDGPFTVAPSPVIDPADDPLPGVVPPAVR